MYGGEVSAGAIDTQSECWGDSVGQARARMASSDEHALRRTLRGGSTRD